MPPNAFVGKTRKPTEAELSEALGRAKGAWGALVATLAEQHGVTEREWRSYSPKAGWSLRLARRRRTIVWLSPCPGAMQVAFILGDGALAAARQANLPKRLRKALEESVRYPEGTGVRIEVRSTRDVPGLAKLALIKLAH
jgi:hypothetical protein